MSLDNWKPRPPLVPLDLKRNKRPLGAWLILSVFGFAVGCSIAWLILGRVKP